MRHDEFQIWLQYHDALFPGYAAWFNGTGDDSVTIRITAWLNRFSQFSLAAVQNASVAMFESRDKPKYHSEHLDWICNRLRPKPLLNDSGPVPHLRKCGLCRDTGMVDVIFHHQQYTPGGNPLHGNRGPAACKCSFGVRLNTGRQNHPEGRPLPVYDATQMDVPQPRRLSDSERGAIVARLRRVNPDLANGLLKIINRGA